MKKWDYLSSYHVYSRSYGHKNDKNGSFLYYFAGDSTKLFTVKAKHLNAPERSF